MLHPDLTLMNECSLHPSLLSTRTSLSLPPSLPSAAGRSRTDSIGAVRGGRVLAAVPGSELEVQRCRRTEQVSGLGQHVGPPAGLGRDVQPELQAGH